MQVLCRRAGPRDPSAEEDPVERLVVRARAERDFVAVAREWASRHGVSAEAFLAEGVPVEVLRAAGFVLESALVERLADEEIRAAMPARQPFTVEGLMSRADRPRREVQATIERAVDEGFIEVVALSAVQGQGRGASLLFRRA